MGKHSGLPQGGRTTISGKFTFTNELGEWGWAVARIGNGTEVVETDAPYLGDPLTSIAALACAMVDAEQPDWIGYGQLPPVRFYTEPGGHLLTVEPSRFDVEKSVGKSIYEAEILPPTTELTFRLDWFDDDLLKEEEPLRTVLDGATTTGEFSLQVLDVLDGVLASHGFGGYRRRWLLHDFPLQWHARLATLHGRTSLTIPL